VLAGRGSSIDLEADSKTYILTVVEAIVEVQPPQDWVADIQAQELLQQHVEALGLPVRRRLIL
jgi:hypothetical protein